MKSTVSYSFLIEEDLSSYGIKCMKVTREQKIKMDNSEIADHQYLHVDVNTELYLTQYIKNTSPKLKTIKSNSASYVIYSEGDKEGKFPVDKRAYNEYDGIFIMKKHDNAKIIEFKEFASQFKDDEEVIVEYDKSEVNLRFIER